MSTTRPLFTLTTDDWPDVIDDAIDRMVAGNYLVRIDGVDCQLVRRVWDALIVKDLTEDPVDDNPNPEREITLSRVRTIHIY